MVRPGPPPDTPSGAKLPAVIAWCAYHLPRWYAIRFPLALAGFLVLFAPFALWGVPAMFRSMLILTGNGLTTVALFATAAGATAIASWRIVMLYGGARFGLFWRPSRITAARLSFPVLLALIAPLLVAAIGTSVREHRVQLIPAVLCALSGIFCGVGLFVLFTILHAAIVEPTDDLPDILLPSDISVVRRAHALTFRRPTHTVPSPWVQWLERYLGPGYFARDGRLLAGHSFAIGLFVIFAALYATGYLWTPGTARGARVPALVYLLGIGTLLTWFFSAFAFWLDRHRLPTIPIVFVLLLGCWALADTDHYFHLSPPSTATPQFESPETIAGARKHDLLTVIAIDGGGIQAGGWAATVLTGIARQWPDFQQSVRFISSVSGGSLASMYFVGELTSSGVLSETQAQRIQRLTMRGSLNEAAWGMAYPDLWRTVNVLPLFPFQKDRGWAIERAWGRDWDNRSATLGSYGQGVMEGWRPAISMNAVGVESGERFAFATFDPPAEWNLATSSTLYHRDIPITTAARMSATFPYVSPIARAYPDVGTIDPQHFADGGYYDNTGMGIAERWLDAALRAPSGQPGAHTPTPYEWSSVAFIRIRSSPNPEPSGKSRGWLYELIGPLETLMSVRSAAQRERADTELDFLHRLWCTANVDIQQFNFAFELKDAAGRYVAPPLSWELSERERENLDTEWKSEHNQAQLQALLDLKDNPWTPMMPKGVEHCEPGVTGDAVDAPTRPIGLTTAKK